MLGSKGFRRKLRVSEKFLGEEFGGVQVSLVDLEAGPRNPDYIRIL